MSNKQAEMQTILDEADLIYTGEDVAQALDAMAIRITEELKDKHPLCLGVMLGGLIPTGQILPRLNFPLELDYIHATRYRGKTEGADLHWLKYPNSSLEGRTLLIIDDILDEGVTLQSIIDYCNEHGAKEVYTAVLVDKQHNRRNGLEKADFVGLNVPDRYVFGHGMDYKGELRHLPGIYAVKGL